MAKSKIKLLTVDLGNFNIKTSENFISENRILMDNERDIFGQETVIYEGNSYFMGVGVFDNEYNKVQKINNTPALLYAIGKSLEPEEEDINLIIGLPVMQIGMKEEMIEKFQEKTFEFMLNGVDRKVNIHKCGVVKESFSAFYSLPQRKGKIAILDIGGRTTNLLVMENSKEIYSNTIAHGTIDFFQDVADYENAKGGNFKVEEIHSYLNDGLDIGDYEKLVNDFATYIHNELKKMFPNIGMYHIKLTGGGAEYFEGALKKYYRKLTKVNDCLLANVKGNYKIGEIKGWDK